MPMQPTTFLSLIRQEKEFTGDWTTKSSILTVKRLLAVFWPISSDTEVTSLRSIQDHWAGILIADREIRSSLSGHRSGPIPELLPGMKMSSMLVI
jgi:hypothetical protein